MNANDIETVIDITEILDKKYYSFIDQNHKIYQRILNDFDSNNDEEMEKQTIIMRYIGNMSQSISEDAQREEDIYRGLYQNKQIVIKNAADEFIRLKFDKITNDLKKVENFLRGYQKIFNEQIFLQSLTEMKFKEVERYLKAIKLQIDYCETQNNFWGREICPTNNN